jgi:hypothetical protein
MPTALPPVHAMPTAQIYCHMCGSIQPLVVDDPQPGDRGQFDNATDLVCGTCQFVVTTTYTLRPEIASEPPEAIGVRPRGPRGSTAGCRSPEKRPAARGCTP